MVTVHLSTNYGYNDDKLVVYTYTHNGYCQLYTEWTWTPDSGWSDNHDLELQEL